MVYWFYGQPGSGKTTLAKTLSEHLQFNLHRTVFRIDGDDLRKLFSNSNYGENGRVENIRRATTIARYLDQMGYDVIVSLVAPYKDVRNELKFICRCQYFYVHTDEVRGREMYFTEIEIDEDDVSIDTTNKSPMACLLDVKDYI